VTSFILPSWRGRLRPGSTHLLDLIFYTHDHLGRFEDRIELVFEDDELNERFVIARMIRVVVGNRKELEALAPISPYVRPRRKRHEGVEDFIEGVKVPFVSDIQWAVKLPQYKVPAAVRDALAVGDLDHQLSKIKQMILPREVTSETYRKHWSSLLHIEEMQMT
jgi:helicase MOV-10